MKCQSFTSAIEKVIEEMKTLSDEEFEEELRKAKEDPLYEIILQIVKDRNQR